MNRKIEKGDRVRVVVEETGTTGSILASSLNKYDVVHGVVEGFPSGDRIRIFKIEELDSEGAAQVVHPESVYKAECDRGHRLVFHDKTREWVCPFCEINYDESAHQSIIQEWGEDD